MLTIIFLCVRQNNIDRNSHAFLQDGTFCIFAGGVGEKMQSFCSFATLWNGSVQSSLSQTTAAGWETKLTSGDSWTTWSDKLDIRSQLLLFFTHHNWPKNRFITTVAEKVNVVCSECENCSACSTIIYYYYHQHVFQILPCLCFLFDFIHYAKIHSRRPPGVLV